MGQNHQEEKRIRRVNRELKYQGAIVDVYSDTIETPDGNIAYWIMWNTEKERRQLCRLHRRAES